jgi:addiction module HigA family antidote
MPTKPVHPGKILAEELAAVGVTPTELARQIDVPPNRICQIVQGKRAISGDTALRLARWFGTRPERWLKLQVAYEIKLAERSSGPAIRRLPTRTRLSQVGVAARAKAAP